MGAKRIGLDTIESLFSAFSNAAILRAEIRRLFDWLKERELTAVITGERGEGTFTRQGLEEYVSDCALLLDHRVQDQISTRRLRIVKYRGARPCEVARLEQQVRHRRRKLEAQIEVLRADMAADEIELKRLMDNETAYLKQTAADEGAALEGRSGLAERKASS